MKPSKRLDSLRKEVDRIDREILNMLQRRFFATKKIQLTKEEEKLPLIQEKRETEILSNLQVLSTKKKLPFSLIKLIYRGIFEFSRKKW